MIKPCLERKNIFVYLEGKTQKDQKSPMTLTSTTLVFSFGIHGVAP